MLLGGGHRNHSALTGDNNAHAAAAGNLTKGAWDLSQRDNSSFRESTPATAKDFPQTLVSQFYSFKE